MIGHLEGQIQLKFSLYFLNCVRLAMLCLAASVVCPPEAPAQYALQLRNAQKSLCSHCAVRTLAKVMQILIT